MSSDIQSIHRIVRIGRQLSLPFAASQTAPKTRINLIIVGPNLSIRIQEG